MGWMVQRGSLLRRGVYGLLLAFGMLLAIAGPASAHALVSAVSPAPGVVLPAAPESVQLTFSEVVEPAQSQVIVLGPDRRLVRDIRLTRDGGNARRLVVSLPPALPRGSYSVT